MPVPQRHWLTHGNNYPLPTGAEALDEPFAAFPSWFMRVTCERCGQERMFSEVHSAQRALLIRDIVVLGAFDVGAIPEGQHVTIPLGTDGAGWRARGVLTEINETQTECVIAVRDWWA
jgi:hypothetical protein